MKKKIYDITPFTTTDYKDHISCIVWFTGCNMKCKYCYNPDIVNSLSGMYSEDDLLAFLSKRIGLLDAVVLSGGEASLHSLKSLCEKIKSMGFKIKLDTNGSKPEKVKELVELGLIDYIALDFKGPQLKYYDITKRNYFDRFIDVLDFLVDSKFNFEVRTTLHEDLLNENDINEMQKVLKEHGYRKTFYIQHFLETENLYHLKKSKKEFDKRKVDPILKIEYRN